MYCGKCGTENTENVNFCKACGAPLNGEAARTKPAVNLRVLGIVAAAIIAVIVTVVCMGSGGNDADAIALQMVEAIFEPDTRKIFDLMPEEVLREEMEMDLVGDDILNETCKTLDNALRNSYGSMEDFEIDCEIVNRLNIKGTDLVMIVEEYQDYDLEVSEACNVTVEVTVTTADGSGTSSFVIPVVKIDNKWYLDYTNMDGLLF